MTDIIAADIGGTNARFARAKLDAQGVPTLGEIRKYKVADFSSLQACWAAFAAEEGGDLPKAASIAFATAIGRDVIKLTNSNWVIRPDTLDEELGLDQMRLVNDFEAVAHAVTRLPPENLPLLFGEDRPFPADGGVTVIGPGTGLGVAMIAYDDGVPHVIATEGGHLDFAPLDTMEEKILAYLRDKFLRVSVERIVSGPGLNNIYKAMATIGHERILLMEDAELWQAALEDSDPFARAAFDRFCLCYGAVAGDLALAHGPHAVVLAGGLTQRMRDLLPPSGFHSRFTAKGRFESLMKSVPIRLALHDEIGLFGAAAAFREKK
ncbi:glucokinase [Sphingobium wenxiniae]|uniref:Glucokinase n=2 Tax=Sphingobium TaxID=165695 RepID=T0FZW5_9SPHN|nr:MULTISPECIES: glucokinase [Sphingobium]EQA96925.1 glucokinase [Sphingobium baderi LL03]KMS64048.1 glucokinase [Sphingobium baderi LL03]MBB6191111.1 glucokinase [Sphingobium wenxiniae]TWH96089.1 glucokinase [Sphingobium wenxiniae]